MDKNKKIIRKIIKEELQKASKVARMILREDSVLKNKNRLLPSEWEEFKEKFLRDNRDHKVVSGKTQYGDRFEAIVKKSNEREAIVKYLPDDMSALHDMKSARFFDYLR